MEYEYYRVIQRNRSKLVTAIKDNIYAIGNKCQAGGLIAADTWQIVLNMTNNVHKATSLLEAIESCIQSNPRVNYEIFMKILDDELPDGSKKILDDIEKDVREKEHAKIAELSTDDTQMISEPVRVRKLRYSLRRRVNTPTGVSVPGPSVQPWMRVTTKKQKKDYGYQHESTDETDTGVYQSISDSDEGLSSPPSPLRRALKQALDQIKIADWDARIDEDEQQRLQQQNRKLCQQNSKLKEQLYYWQLSKDKKKLIKKLKNERNNLKTIKKKKEEEATELSLKIKTLETTLYNKKGEFDAKCTELVKQLSLLEYEMKEKQEEIKSLKEELKSQELQINEKENALIKLNNKVEMYWQMLVFVILVLILSLVWYIYRL